MSDQPQRRRHWRTGLVGFVLVALVLGRWVVLGRADAWWAESLGVGASHADIARVKWLLISWTFITSSIWCAGNLYVVYRSIGSVHVPRRLGNLEILEAVPRHYLVVIMVGFCGALAASLSLGSSDWWQFRLLAGHGAPLGVLDPILGRDLSYYLFALPWQRALHGFAVVSAIVLLGVVGVMYFAIGAIRWVGRGLEFSPSARQHMAALLVLLAVTLIWGYRLEPFELVAGLQGGAVDAVTTDVRIPTSRLLAALAVLAMVTSLVWMKVERLALVAFGWTALISFSVVGHYVVPVVAATARSDQERELAGVREFRSLATQIAFDVPSEDSVFSATLVQRVDTSQLTRAPIWDEPIGLTVFEDLNDLEPHLVVRAAHLMWYPDAMSRTPIVVGIREPSLTVARRQNPNVSWDAVHTDSLGSTSGVMAFRADRVGSTGQPLFLRHVSRVDDVSETPVFLESTQGRPILFSPSVNEFLLVGADRGDIRSVPMRSMVRRVALAWRFQSFHLLRERPDHDAIVWDRGITERLEQYLPFATFEAPFPILEDESVHWAAWGYVSSPGFPLAAPVLWRNTSVRYLQAGFIGLVNAHTGQTRVYRLADLDPVSLAWAQAVPDLVEPLDSMPSGLRTKLEYPKELFAVQARMAARVLETGVAGQDIIPPGRARGGPPRVVGDSYTWFGPMPWNDRSIMHRIAPLERGDPGWLTAFVDGTLVGSSRQFKRYRIGTPLEIPGPSQISEAFADRLGSDLVHGPMRVLPYGSGVLSYLAEFTPTRALVGVHASWGDDVATGASLTMSAMEATLRRPGPDESGALETARVWFRRLDAARLSGDWVAFGEAYEALKRLLQNRGDGR